MNPKESANPTLASTLDLPDATESAVLVADPNQTILALEPPARPTRNPGRDFPSPPPSHPEERTSEGTEEMSEYTFPGAFEDAVEWARSRFREIERPLEPLVFGALGLAVATAVAFVVALGLGTFEESAPSIELSSPSGELLAGDARRSIREGDARGAAARIEQLLASEAYEDDPFLHAAAANALVHLQEEAKAMPHFERAIERDPNALEEEDLAFLVGILTLSREDGQRAAKLLERLGPRARAPLRAMLEDRTADRRLRSRARRVLRTIDKEIGGPEQPPTT